MSLPRYPVYKDSGVAWLGEVPGHWIVTALKRGFDVTLGKMLQPESNSPDDELLPYLRAANIQWSGMETTDIKQMWLSKRDRAQLRLERDDLLVSEGGDVGRSCLWAAEIDECYFQNSVNRVRVRDGNSNHYLYYWMSVIKDKGYIDVLCNKSTIAHFTAEKVAAVPVPFPPPEEQFAIAIFLDRETGKIDALVAEQEKLIQLLREKRQAVISHAVTKGLNPAAPMKDSGIEWLGDVPAHWEVVPLKQVVSQIESGVSVNASDQPASETELGVLKTSCVYSGQFDANENKTVIEAEIDRVACPLKAGTLIVSRMNTPDLVGAAGLVKCAPQNIYLPDRLWQVSFSSAAPAFVHYWTQSVLYRAQIRVVCAGTSSSMQNLGQDQFRTFSFPNPPQSEQEAIADFLDREIAKLDELTAEAQHGIELLKERRSALISAAVTGKIDVRGVEELKP